MNIQDIKLLSAAAGLQHDGVIIQAITYINEIITMENKHELLPLQAKLLSRLRSQRRVNSFKFKFEDELIIASTNAGLTTIAVLQNKKSQQIYKLLLSDPQATVQHPRSQLLFKLMAFNVDTDGFWEAFRAACSRQPSWSLQLMANVLRLRQTFTAQGQIQVSSIIVQYLNNEPLQKAAYQFKSKYSDVYSQQVAKALSGELEVKGVNVNTNQVIKVLNELVYSTTDQPEIEAKYMAYRQHFDLKTDFDLTTTLRVIERDGLQRSFCRACRSNTDNQLQLLQYLLQYESSANVTACATNHSILSVWLGIPNEITVEELKTQLELMDNLIDGSVAEKLQLFIKKLLAVPKFVSTVVGFFVNQLNKSKIVGEIKSADESTKKIIIGDGSSVVRLDGIPKPQVIPKNCDLKTEMKIKKENLAREQLIQVKIVDETEERKQYVEKLTKVLGCITDIVMYISTKSVLLQMVQEQLIELVTTIFNDLPVQQFIKQVIFIMNVLLSYVHGKHIVQAVNSQPLTLVAVVRHMFGDSKSIDKYYQKLQEQALETEFPLFLQQNDISGSFEELITRQLSVWDQISLQFPIQTIIPFLMQMKCIPEQLQSEFVLFTSRLTNQQLNYKNVLQILMTLNYQGFPHEKAVEKCITLAGQHNIQIDENFMQPIMDHLMDDVEQKRHLAIIAITYIPQNKQIIYSQDKQLLLLLTEHLSDAIKRFYISCGGRSEFLKQQGVLMNLLEISFKKENENMLEYVPEAVTALCMENASLEFMSTLQSFLLQEHYNHQGYSEDTRYDINTHDSKCRSCIWRIIGQIANYSVAFDADFDMDLPIGIIAIPPSNMVPLQLHVPLNQQDVLIKERKDQLNAKSRVAEYKIVKAINDETTFMDTLKQGASVSVETNPVSLSNIQAVLERFLAYGIFDFDDITRQHAIQAIKLIIYQIGHQYNQKLTYALETGRKDMLPNIKMNQLMYSVFNRLFQWVQNLQQFGLFFRFTIDQSQISNIDMDRTGDCLVLLSYVAQQFAWHDPIRGQVIDYVEQLSQLQDLRLDSNFNKSLSLCWDSLLQGQIVLDNNIVLKYPHQNYKNIDSYVQEFLLSRYADTIKFNSTEFPGAVHCLAGVIQKCGLNYLVFESSTLVDVGCYCLRHEKTMLQIQGLKFIIDLLFYFGNLLEPYLPLFIQDILFLASSKDKIVVQFSQQIMIQILRSVSQFGISHLSQIIVEALDEENDWELINGAVNFTYSIVSNSAKLPTNQFKSMLTKLIPILLPKLQQNIYHPQLEVKLSVLKAIEKVAEMIQSPLIRVVSKRIIDSYVNPDMARNVLIDITEMQFSQHIDAASIILIFPLCDKVLRKESAIQFASPGDRMKHLHVKCIAASVLGLLSEITNQNDFASFIPQIKEVLIGNLRDTNDDIRKQCAISLAQVVHKTKNVAFQLQNELIDMIKRPDVEHSLSHGLSVAIVNLAFQLNNQFELFNQLTQTVFLKLDNKNFKVDAQCSNCQQHNNILLDNTEVTYNCKCGTQKKFICDKKLGGANMLSIMLYLLYIPQKLIENGDRQQIENFSRTYLQDSMMQMISFIDSPVYKQNEQLILKICRQLVTSFISEVDTCVIVGKILRDALTHQCYDVREVAISLVGDVVSEIGSSVMEKSTKQEKEELKQIKLALNEIKVSGLADEKNLKVFIPEKAINYAMQMLSSDVYYQLVLNLFIIRCDQTGNLRHQAVNMWKLVTIKPLTTINGFLQFVVPVLLTLLNKYYQNSYEFDYKKLVLGVVQELMVNCNNTQFTTIIQTLYDELQHSDNDIKLISLLDIFSAVAKNDKNNIFIKESLILELPQLIKSASDERVINSAATLLSSLQTDVSSLLDNIVQPQIAKICQVPIEEIPKLAQSINIIIGTRQSIVDKLIGECLDIVQTNENYAHFLCEFYKVSTLLQQDPKNLVQLCTSRLLADGSKINNTILDHLALNRPVEAVHPCLLLLKQMITLTLEAYETLMFQAFNTALSNIPDVLTPTCLELALLLKCRPSVAAQNPALITSSIQACFGNLNQINVAGCFGFLIQQLGQLYGLLKDEDVQKQYAQLLITQCVSALQTAVHARHAKLPALLAQLNRCQDLIQVCCLLQSPQTKTFEPLREQALTFIVLIILSALHTNAADKSVQTQNIQFDDFQFTVPTDAVGQKPVFLLSSAIAGRAVMTLRMPLNESHKVALVRSLGILAQIAPIQQFETALRPEIERHCLLMGTSKIVDEAVICLKNLFALSAKKENGIHSLLNILIKSSEGKATQMNEQLHPDLAAKIYGLLGAMMRTSSITQFSLTYKQNDLKLTGTNIYVDTAQLLWMHVMLTENDLKRACGAAIAETLHKLLQLDQTTFEVQIMQLIFQQANYVLVGCSQLIVLQNLIRISLECGTAQQCLQSVQHAAESIEIVAPALGNTTLVKYLSQKLNVQSDSQLHEVAEVVVCCGYLQAAADQHQSTTIQRALSGTFAKAVEALTTKFKDLNDDQMKSVLTAMMVYEKYGKQWDTKPGQKQQMALLTMNYLQKCIMAAGVCENAQHVLIEFYSLRFGLQNFEAVAKVLKVGNPGMVADMEQRVNQIAKLIKAGKV